MLQLRNASSFSAFMAVHPDVDGVDTLFVVAKGAFTLSERPEFATEQVAVVKADTYYGEPGASSLEFASEVHPAKVGTDAVLVGSAWAPNARAVPQLDVVLRIAELEKTVRVTGDREWKKGFNSPSISPPKPFERMPLTFERAFGGTVVDPESGKVSSIETNPVGVGYAGTLRPEAVVGRPLPNLEDPRHLVTKPSDVAAPAGFGFVAASWMPRRGYAGTYDDAWQRGRAPYLPADFDRRFLQTASSGLTFDRTLTGGETGSLDNASPQPSLKFRVPSVRPVIDVKFERRIERLGARMETVLIQPDDGLMLVTWRGAFPCDKAPLRVRSVDIGMEG